jgi:transcriptional regulator GlxA family with amidase domain
MRNRHLAMAMQLMETHLDDPLCMKDVARQIGLSVRQLERLFQRHLNASPNRHYMVLRMTRARKLLSQTELSITDIALACGFTSPSHFSKKYREYFGQSAQQHRTVNAPFGPSSFDLVG